MIKKLNHNAKKVDKFLKKYLKSQKKTNLIIPMSYGTLSGGKKIRSSIIFDTGKIFKLKEEKILFVCAAVELIHSYSLIHDDLPCMDDDKIRRGKPSTHIKFGESTAVLAGNSLLTLAFEIITEKKFNINEKLKLDLMKNLAICSGHTGVAGGQELDLRYEKQKKNLNQILEMHRKKTGKLFSFCCYAIGVLANKTKNEKKQLSKIGEDIGLLFQLADDFLDVKGSLKKIGKPIKQDVKKGKSTLISIIGFKNSYDFATKLQSKILRNLKKYGKKADNLSETVKFILERKY